MTLLNPHAAGRSRSTSAGTGSAVTHGIKKAWEVVWLLVVPLLVAVYVDMQAGDTWGSIPAFWLDGNPPATGTAGPLALLGVFATCVALRRLHADLLLGVLPVAGAITAHLGFGGSPAGWIGAVVGLAVGALVLHRRQGSR